MRGSAAFRSAIAPGGLLAGPWVQNELWRRAKAKPSLDLRFAENKSLVDATTGQNLVTFTRASSATYVDSTGTIRSAVTNLLVRSEEFDNASWIREKLSSVTANAAVAPNGTLTADKIIEDSTATSIHAIYQSVSGLPDSATFTFSVYLKASERTKAVVAFMDKAAVTRGMLFDLAAGTVATFNKNGITDPNGSSIAAIGDGWYRCSVRQSTGTGAFNPRTWVQLISGTTNSYTGDGTSGLFLWGAQLEQSSTVGEYVPTTSTINSAPRFDHNPTTGESLGLLVEEARTNLLLNSATLSTQNVTVTAAAHTLSFSGTGTITLSGTSTAGPLVGTGTSEANRVSLTFTPTAGTLTLTVSGTVSNAQLELGSFRTSYIPTTSATATRSADVASISSFSGLVGCLFGQFSNLASGSRGIASVNDNSANNRIELRTSGTDPFLTVVNGGTTQADIDAGTVSANAVTSLSGRVATDNFGASVAGGTEVLDTSGSVPAVTQLQIGRDQAGNYLNGRLSRLAVWPQPLTTLQALTQ